MSGRNIKCYEAKRRVIILAVDLPAEIIITARRGRSTSAHVQRRAKITPWGYKPVGDSPQTRPGSEVPVVLPGLAHTAPGNRLVSGRWWPGGLGPAWDQCGAGGETEQSWHFTEYWHNLQTVSRLLEHGTSQGTTITDSERNNPQTTLWRDSSVWSKVKTPAGVW